MAALFAASPIGKVLINEIHYDPPVKTDQAEFIELYNSGAETVDLAGWQLTGGVDYIFGPDTQIAPNAFVVIAENPAAFTRKFGRTAFGPWDGLLANAGEKITLREASGQVVDEVEYKLGFPWPTVGDLPGYSIELTNPAFDNDLGGNWRPSVKGTPTSGTSTLIAAGTSWRYLKGTVAPPATWRDPLFSDLSWTQGSMPIGYDPAVPLNTGLADMRGSYTSVFFRKQFTVTDAAAIGALRLEAMYDDGFKLWINGKLAVNSGLPPTEVPHTATSTGGARESDSYDQFLISSPGNYLQNGENTVAVQLHNVSLADSSDCYLDLRLIAEIGSANAGPTPGARNAAFTTNVAPQIRQVEHSPEQPIPDQPVTITAKVSDPDGIGSVQLQYQVLDPGNYIELNDAAYATTWTSLSMKDDGTGGDAQAQDDVFTAILPASLQLHRRLVRYRILAADTKGLSLRAPYLDDPTPNFAYFVYAGIPQWRGAARPGTTAIETFASEEMSRLPAYHLIAKRTSVETATWDGKYTGDLYRWWGTLVYDGKVYDHIRYRARGGVWRYAMGKNMWKFDFNRGHDFEPRDNYGEKYQTTWRKLNLGANIQQGNFQHRGEQGMFESVGFRLFNLAGVECPKTHWATLRIIDEAQEADASQYNGDLWGLYLAIEQEDGRFLDEHQLPDGNLYKMENFDGELNNQGRTSATDKSDLNSFTSGFSNTTPTEAWWRQNFDIDKYYSYQAIVQGIHHYDICYGKNYFYFLNPNTRKWSVHTWDLDLTWADNMYDSGCGAVDEFKNRVSGRAPFNLEYRNRIRELRDLLFNSDQAGKVIDEYAGIVRGTNRGPNILAADRAMWDYHPVMVDGGRVNTGQAGHGQFYRFPLESGSDATLRGSFEAVTRIMKNYVNKRGAVLDGLAADAAIPIRPTISYNGPAGYPVNRLQFRSSDFSGSAGFAAMKWRVGEVRQATAGVRGIYEIEPLWETPEITTFSSTINVPAEKLEVGHRYRARVRMKDSTGRWSNWSEPVEFLAAEPDNATALTQNLRITEIMYNPPVGNDFEFVELHNTSTTLTLQLGGVAFTEGIDFAFPAGAALAPGEYALVTRGTEAAFRSHYGLGASGKVFGPFTGALNNDGEKLTVKTATSGTVIASVAYNDRAGWPISPDGTGHSLVPKEELINHDFPGHWRPSNRMRGSPGTLDETPINGVVLNEVAAHTDHVNPARPEYDSNDWIELYNAGTAVSLGEYYLSDDASNLKKWRLPNSVLNNGARISFDEITGFHNPITAGFGLDKAGEELYLSLLPGTAADRVVDAIRFKGQAGDRTYGRFPDGADVFYLTLPTRDASNALASPELVISEIMYHPGQSTTLEEAWQEYVEIHNPSSIPLPLGNTNGAYRLDGGIAFNFPTNLSVPANGALLVVSFSPLDAAAKGRFVTHYSITGNALMTGPFTGRLGNDSDRVAIEKPEAPDLPGEPLGWIIVDEAIYTDESGADHTGESLTRISFRESASDPRNWNGATPTPGVISINQPWDADRDGLPDDWERNNGLNPTDATDAALDSDNDGLSNLAEFTAGTDPRSSASSLKLQVSREPIAVKLAFAAQPSKSYTIQYRDTLLAGAWVKLRDISNSTGVIEVSDSAAAHARYYRLLTPALP